MVDLAHGRLGGGAMRSSPESSPSGLRRACARRAAECSRACFIAGVVQLQQWFSGFSGACGWLWAATIAWRGSDGGGVQWRRLRGATPHLFDFFFLSLSLRRTTWHFHELLDGCCYGVDCTMAMTMGSREGCGDPSFGRALA